MPKLLVATKNPHKTSEIRAILGEAWEVSDLSKAMEIPAPEETGETFEENARIKAEAASLIFPGLVLSDDSGLEVDALGGDPGVQSALYAGRHGDDAANRARLRRELLNCGLAGPWKARFRCCMALAQDGRAFAVFDGSVEGFVFADERGDGGFGYDSMFTPDGHEKTFGELAQEFKNSLSHRSSALAKVVSFLKNRHAAAS